MKKLNIAIIILFAIAAVCGFYFVSEYHTAQEEIAEYTLLQESYTETKIELLDEAAADPQEIHAALPYRYPDWTALQQENPDLIGWLSIPYSPVNYPVVQTTDNYTYLNRSFSGEKSSTGAAFMDANNNADPLDQNTIIYAHNMGSGRQDMFGSLLKYKDREYYDTHPYIQFDTVYQQHGWWRIFAVIDHNIKSGDFNYLKLNFADQEEFAAWIAQAMELSLYETGVAVSPDDKVLTLSTCDRSIHGRSGRQLVITEIYADDGLTGDNTDRKDFQRMMIDIEIGKISCVIVKDLSRFGRGTLYDSYIYDYFPERDVRFVAIGDDVDSAKGIDEMSIQVYAVRDAWRGYLHKALG